MRRIASVVAILPETGAPDLNTFLDGDFVGVSLIQICDRGCAREAINHPATKAVFVLNRPLAFACEAETDGREIERHFRAVRRRMLDQVAIAATGSRLQ